MKYPRPRRRETRDKVIIMTGGLNDTVTNLELDEGELQLVKNYMEIDSPYHGYTSVGGYEVYDGKTPPSSIPAPLIVDRGNDTSTVFLIEGPTGSEDISDWAHLVQDSGPVGIDKTKGPFTGGCFEFALGTHYRVDSSENGPFDTAFSSAFWSLDSGPGVGQSLTYVNLGPEFTIDLFIQPRTATLPTHTIFEKAGCYKLQQSSGGNLIFSTSSDGVVYDQIITTTPEITVDRFTHVSLSAWGNIIRFGVNGVKTDELAYTRIHTNTEPLYIGQDALGTEPFNGWMDEFRLSSIARWIDGYVVPTVRYSDNEFGELQWNDVERERQRALITEVPGSGPCTGVHIYQGEVYALRNDQSGDFAALWRANRVYESDGTTIDNNASGWVLVDDSFNANGRLDAENWRFSGSFDDKQVMCIVDGVSLPRIWDRHTDTMYQFTNTEADGIPDRQNPPRYAHIVSVFDNRLVLGYHENDLILSSKTDPRDYTGGFGDQLLVGDDITNFQELPGEALGVFCRNSVKVLTKLEQPTSNAASPDYTFKIESYSREAGALPWSAERVLSKIIYADDRGVVDFSAVDKYGDFEATAISKNVNRTFLAKKNLVTTSLVEKQTGQYRVFFSDNTSIWFTFTSSDAELKGATIIEYLTPVLIATEGEDPNGSIVKYFTSDDGFIYQMDSGTSFNGEAIDSILFTSFYHYGSPRNWKEFMRGVFEVTADKGTRLYVRSVFDYDDSDFPETLWEDWYLRGAGAPWGEVNWGEFVWGAAAVDRVIYYIRGHGTNMSLEFRVGSKYTDNHIIHNAIVDYVMEDKQR